MLITILSACTPTENVIPKPEITVYLQDSWNEDLKGHVFGADANLFNIAIYANINDGWYNQPDKASPVTPISEDGSWTCNVNIEPTEFISKLSVYLLPNGYFPPIVEGESTIPLKLNLVSSAKKTILFN